MYPGDKDIDRAVEQLALQLPGPLRPLARVAYDYRWSWSPDGAATFRRIDPARWERCGANPLRLLTETPRARLEQAAEDADFVRHVERLAQELQADRQRPCCPGAASIAHPVAFCCAEFGVHGSLPIYSGGLGVLAGDILKEASDLALPMVGVGLLYRTGYFHQRIDVTGMQHEYWLDADPERLPCVPVTGADGQPLTVMVPVDDEDLAVQVWRVDVGRVPLYLLDTDLPQNSAVGRWVTSRLYESNRAIRLAQYAVLGIGGVRALQALGIEPAVYHLNEGHPALGVFELLAQARARRPDVGDDAAWQQVREQVVFTTHTPVAAGNETYARDELLAMLGRVADASGDRERFLALGRIDPADAAQPSGMTALALRCSRGPMRSVSATARWRAACGSRCSRGARRRACRSPMSPTASTCPPGCRARCASCSTATWARAGCPAPTSRRPGRRWTISRRRSCGPRAVPRASSWWAWSRAAPSATGCAAATRWTMHRPAVSASTPAG